VTSSQPTSLLQGHNQRRCHPLKPLFKERANLFEITSKERKGVDKTKYCRFHKCHEHVTNDCIHLKDAIELLTQQGWLKQFVKNPESERKTIELIADGNKADTIVDMSVEHLGDFPDNVEIVPYSYTWEQFPSVNISREEH